MVSDSLGDLLRAHGVPERIVAMVVDVADYEGRRVAEDVIGSTRVSTVRMPQSFEGEGTWWQTAIFGLSEQRAIRSDTEEEARENHAVIVRRLRE